MLDDNRVAHFNQQIRSRDQRIRNLQKQFDAVIAERDHAKRLLSDVLTVLTGDEDLRLAMYAVGEEYMRPVDNGRRKD